jgi:hypothetical protein
MTVAINGEWQPAIVEPGLKGERPLRGSSACLLRVFMPRCLHAGSLRLAVSMLNQNDSVQLL